MKQIVISSAICLTCGIGLFFIKNNKNECDKLTDLQLANIEAIGQIELGEVTITCSYPEQGRCWTFGPWKMIGERMYQSCIFTGYQYDYCKS